MGGPHPSWVCIPWVRSKCGHCLPRGKYRWWGRERAVPCSLNYGPRRGSGAGHVALEFTPCYLLPWGKHPRIPWPGAPLTPFSHARVLALAGLGCCDLRASSPRSGASVPGLGQWHWPAALPRASPGGLTRASPRLAVSAALLWRPAPPAHSHSARLLLTQPWKLDTVIPTAQRVSRRKSRATPDPTGEDLTSLGALGGLAHRD